MNRSGPLRVAQVVRPATGGIQQHVTALVSSLNRAEFTQTLCAPDDFTLGEIGYEVPRVPTAIGAKTHPLRDARAILRLTPVLRDQFDLVHAHGLRGALIGVLAARRAGVPALFTAHNLVPPLGLLPRLLLAHVGRTADRILAVSQAVKRTLIAARIPADKITVVSNGVEIARFDGPVDSAAFRASLAIPPKSRLIAAVGRLAPEKGFLTLFEAFALIAPEFPDLHLMLAGSGPEENRLRALRDQWEQDLWYRSRLPGRLPDVAPLLRTADIVAIPSLQEGQGLVALEAMAACRPVVASRVGGLTETVIEGETGLLVEPSSASALADALRSLLRDAPRCERMGAMGRTHVERDYTLERMLSLIAQNYRSLAP